MMFLRPLVRYADFSGRARRSEYFGFLLFQSVVGGLLAGLAILSLSQSEAGAGAMGFFTCLALAGVCALVFVVPHLAVTVRRLHDTDRSAWWMLLQAPSSLAPLIFISAIAGVAGAEGKPSDATMASIVSAASGGVFLLGVGSICNAVLMVILWLRGTPGENRFGADPRGPDGRFETSATASLGRLDEARLDALFAEARLASTGSETDGAGWKPNLDFGPMHGRPDVKTAPMTRAPSPAWPDAAPSFGRRRN